MYRIQYAQGEGCVLAVSSATDDGYLEGTVRGSGATGLFPQHCVQEVRLRQNTAHLHQVTLYYISL